MPALAADALLAWGRSLGLTGAAGEPRTRPWGTTVRLGDAWLKACGPGVAHEPALVAALAARGLAAPPLAVGPGRLALRDAGVPLCDVPGGGARWPALLEEHAALQRALQDEAAALLALGVPDARPARLPDQLDALLARHPVDADLRAALQRALPRLRDDGALLEDGPVSLQHDDLHDGNVLVAPDGTATVVDWGDACVGHAFGLLLVTLRALRSAGAGASLLDRCRDAYLGTWGDPASLREHAAAAQRVQALGRALCWERALLGAGAAERAPWGDPVSGWLEVLAGVED